MKFRAKNIEECTTLFEIEVSEHMIARAVEEVYAQLVKIANVPGYRVGKAPIEVVKIHYAKDAKEEALKRLIPEAYRKALSEHSVTPISLPEISDVAFEDDKPLTFKAKVDIRPKFKLKHYKGINLEKKKAAITDSDVEKTLQNLREISAKYASVEGRPVEMGDYVVSDLECFVDGKSIHKKRENLWLTVEKESFIPGLTEKMAGMNKGEERDIEIVLPANYPDKNVAGKKSVYHVVAKEIKARHLPDLNDDFAKDVGKETLAELKAEITGELEARARSGADIETENHLLNKLADDNVFTVPSSFVARQLEYMVEDAKDRLEAKGFKRDDLNKKDAEFKEKFKDDAVRQVRLFFILDEIANIEKIEVATSDVDEAYKAIASRSGKAEKDVREHYEKEELVDNLKDKIREGKTVKFLLDNANIVEK